MPFYKLHEGPPRLGVAPVASPPFASPGTTTHAVLAQHMAAQHAAAASQHRAAAAAAADPNRMLIDATVAAAKAAAAANATASATAPPHPALSQSLQEHTSKPPPPPMLENAHFGHSLYFIEHLFPSKLWRILDDAERFGYDNIISWVDNGMAFQIHDRENIIPILEKYFSMSKYKSFLRQLQAYGFQRAAPNPKDDPCRDSKPKRDSYRGKWSHKLFRRDKMNLCNKMTRDGKKQQQEKDGAAASSSSEKKSEAASSTTTTSPRKSSTASSSKTSTPGSTPPQSPQQRNSIAGPHRIHQSQVAIAKHHQHQKELAAAAQAQAQQKQQQQQQQQQMQLIHNRILQQHAPAPGVHYHDPRYSAHAQPPPFQQQRHPHHPPIPAPGSPPSSGLSPALLARVQQQQQHQQQHQEEQKRQQLQMHLHQLKEQQLLSSILQSRGEAAPGATAPAPNPPSGAPAPASQTLLAGVNYNQPSSAVPVAAPLPGSPASKGIVALAPPPLAATEAVSEAANELRRAELALAERRRRLAEAQERAQKEAEALAKAEAAIARAHSTARGQSPPLAAASSSSAELLLRQHRAAAAPVAAKPPPTTASLETVDAATKQRLLGGLPLTSLLEDLDNAFKTSTGAPVPAAAAKLPTPPAALELKITEEELLRARAGAAGPVGPMQHVVHPPRPATAPGTVPPGSPGPTAAEREVMMARLNAMEHIRLREQQHPQQQQSQAMGSSHQQLLMKIAMADREEQEQRQRMAAAKAASANGGAATSNAVRDAIRNAAVGLISGGHPSAAATTAAATSVGPLHPPHTATAAAASAATAANHMPPTAGILDRMHAPPTTPGLPPATGMISKEMMDIFAKTAAAAISGKTVDGSSGNSSENPTAANSRNPSPPTTVPTTTPSASEASVSIKPPALAPAVSKEILPPSSTGSSSEAALSASLGSRGSTTASSLPDKTPSVASPAIAPAAAAASSHLVSNSELEAARALMRIPGTVEQSGGEPMVGHWELVKPEELKTGSSLSKALPEVVTKSADLTYEAYKAMATKLTPPKVMRIPEGWNAQKEPVYLVVDPANMGASALPPTSVGALAPSPAVASAHLQPKAPAATLAGTPGLP